MTDWIKFHAELRDGEKRALPRETRFVFLELALLARKKKGEVVCPKFPTALESVHDLLGGDRKQIKAALAALTAAEMITVTQTPSAWVVAIPSWAKWNGYETSTERVQQHRQRKREKDATPGNGFSNDGATQPDGCETQPRAHTRPSAPSPSSSLSSISSLISSSSLVSAPSQPRAREDFDPADKAVRLVLARRDLWPAEYVTDAEIVAVVSRCRAAWRDEPAAKRLGLTLEHALREAINDAQMFSKRYTSATPEQLLARIEQRVEWILGECRSGRRKATVAATESDVAEDAQDSADAILARQEADRRRSEAEQAKTRAFANDPAAKAKREADLARLARAAAPEQFSRKPAAPEGSGK